jgi:hypothetical protein
MCTTAAGVNTIAVKYIISYHILDGSVHTIQEEKKNRAVLVVSSNEIGLEVNTDKIKYMFMSRDQDTGRNHNVNIDDKSFGRAEKFKYLGKPLTNQNSIQRN